ncbi:MAG TPA: divergent polysaccharide deacetylase family protein [Roseiarcus sp.]
MRDELNEPLGLASCATTAPPAGQWRAVTSAVVAAAALAATIGFVTLARRESQLGGEPFAVATVEVAPAPSGPAAPDVTASAHAAAPPPIAAAEQVEAASGVKVTRAGGGGPPNARIIDVERALAVRLNAAPDPRLIEKSRTGPLPRVGANGARPFEVYARPALFDPKLNAGAPRVALMVGGLGLSIEGAEAAIAKLPGAVTLGFAPSGVAIEQRAAEAREAGHETALQAPMEDFSYGTGDSGPHMLKTSASDADNIESLRWLMSRFTGYVAVANHLGGKFTADPKEISPILTEIAARGLGYLDDGASPRSVAPDVAATLALPWARADLVIDANPSPEAIEAALARLLDRARERGSAIGVASASPISVELLARWANGLEAKGVALVPLSALMSARPSPSAQSNP